MTASAREVAPILRYTAWICVFTVLDETHSQARYLIPAQMGGEIVEYLPFPLRERLDHGG